MHFYTQSTVLGVISIEVVITDKWNIEGILNSVEYSQNLKNKKDFHSEGFKNEINDNLNKEKWFIFSDGYNYSPRVIVANFHCLDHKTRIECSDMLTDLLPFTNGERRKTLVEVSSIINDAYMTAVEHIIVESKPNKHG